MYALATYWSEKQVSVMLAIGSTMSTFAGNKVAWDAVHLMFS